MENYACDYVGRYDIFRNVWEYGYYAGSRFYIVCVVIC